MTEWTSISVTVGQKEELEQRKESANHEGAMGAFLLDSIDGGPNPDVDRPVDEQAIAEAVRDDLVAELPRKIAEELR